MLRSVHERADDHDPPLSAAEAERAGALPATSAVTMQTVSQEPAAGNGAHRSAELLVTAGADTDAVLRDLGTQLRGLSEAEAASRVKQAGTNEIAREKRQSAL